MSIRKLYKEDDYDWLYEEYYILKNSAEKIGISKGIHPTVISFYVYLWDIPQHRRSQKNMVEYISKEDLYQSYIVERLSISKISVKYNCAFMIAKCWLIEYELERMNVPYQKADMTPAYLYELYIIDNHSISSISKVTNLPYKFISKRLLELDLIEFKKSNLDLGKRIDRGWLLKTLRSKSKEEIIKENPEYNPAQLEYYIDNINLIYNKQNTRSIHQDSKRRYWIKEHYNDENLTMSDICDVFGCGLIAIECYLKEMKLEILPIGHYEEKENDKEEFDNRIIELLLDGISPSEVSTIVEYSYSYVKKIYFRLKKEGKI